MKSDRDLWKTFSYHNPTVQSPPKNFQDGHFVPKTVYFTVSSESMCIFFIVHKVFLTGIERMIVSLVMMRPKRRCNLKGINDHFD